MKTHTMVPVSHARTLLVVSLFAYALFAAAPAHAASDYLLKLGGVEGESTTKAAAPARAVEVAPSTGAAAGAGGTVARPTVPQEAKTDMHIKIDTIEGESAKPAPGVEPDEIDVAADGGAAKKGKVEANWKVEEAEKGAPAGDMSRDVATKPVETMPDFAILLGGSEGQSDEERAQGLERARQVILVNAQASDQSVEEISLNYEKITTRVRHEVRLFGLIPVQTTAEVDIDDSQEVKVRFPWWAFLATGADEAAVGEQVFQTVSNVLKTKHDMIKTAVQNIR